MTHRSRTGGPPRQRQRAGGKSSKTSNRKLHHPPTADSQLDNNDIATRPQSLSALPPSDSRRLSFPADSEILQVIHTALRPTLDSATFVEDVQKVKGLLYERKWLEVFGDKAKEGQEKEEEGEEGSRGLLEVYAGRWVPGRALCFRNLMGGLDELRSFWEVGKEKENGEGRNQDENEVEDEDEDDVEDEAENENVDETSSSISQDTQEPSTLLNALKGINLQDDHGPESSTSIITRNIISLGGGAASELLAVSALVHSTLSASPSASTRAHWSWTGVDIGTWSGVIDSFHKAINTTWNLSSVLDVSFLQKDMISVESHSSLIDLLSPKSDDNVDISSPSDINSLDSNIDTNTNTDTNTKIDIDPNANTSSTLITLFFTLSELLSQSRTSTIALLHLLTTHSPSGTYFLVADTASDISDLEVGAQGRKWPNWMILDMILVGNGNGKQGQGQGGWVKVDGEDARWFRLGDGVGAGWRVKLENTRYWFRLYRRV
ncbi:hypothetical protein BCR39DRAFT_563579 [Naematelia encephala]|uniref:Cytoplasmic protein n=1 Tax=Naematelia encephala TaxID=71784 RepID=A0A1Y2BJQ1_9TREE|nr:hypothetical protein BCR39DRAFT_563579 [Naematelia encephala]